MRFPLSFWFVKDRYLFSWSLHKPVFSGFPLTKRLLSFLVLEVSLFSSGIGGRQDPP